MADVARLARIEEKTIRNWIARDLIDAGTKIGPRWTFTPTEALTFKIASYLVSCTRMEANVAARIAAVTASTVRTRIDEMTERNAAGNLIEMEAGFQHWQAILVAIEGDMIRTAIAGADPSRRDPPRHTDARAAFLGRPHVVIPIDTLATSILFDIDRLLDGEPLEGEQ